MQKIEIAQRIHQEAGIPLEESAELLDWILDLLKTTLQKGEPITIMNFGRLSIRSKQPRPGRNPRTGEPIMIGARRVVTFRASDHLTAEMNEAGAVTTTELERKDMLQIQSNDVK